MTDAELLQEVKDYLRISHKSEDKMIVSLINTAKDLIKESAGKDFSGTNLEMLCMKMLLENWYAGSIRPENYSVQNVLRIIELQN